MRRLVDDSCDRAQEFAKSIGEIPSARVLNQVVLNQVLFRVEPDGVDDPDGFNSSVAARIQRAGICWIGTTVWEDRTALRISVSNAATTSEDVCASVSSLRDAIDQELNARRKR